MLNKNKSSKSYFSCRPTRVLEFFLVYCLLLLPSTIFPRLGAEKNKDSWNHAAGFLVGMAWCEFWNTQTVYKVLWTKKNKMARSWHTSSDWPLAFPGWFWMNRVRSTSSLSLLFSFWSVTVPGILMIHNLTFQPSVFTLHFPEKQFYGSSWIHFFILFAPFGCISVEDCAVLQVLIKWAGWGNISNALFPGIRFFVVCPWEETKQNKRIGEEVDGVTTVYSLWRRDELSMYS